MQQPSCRRPSQNLEELLPGRWPQSVPKGYRGFALRMVGHYPNSWGHAPTFKGSQVVGGLVQSKIPHFDSEQVGNYEVLGLFGWLNM